ncbi:MAG: hypothetical protein RMJ59_04985 [Candidatus Nitrosocaldus sp.]|nr:hypothetical protein [Candidatus Nitrosocaldus sp.]MCS7141379.1 hypothetical protein [Candidatus Nitrosocaldus sp.]MDW8000741.1 hypothetical protein [Candidatus Nitrosocaldus sp.]MDW8275718.1 hypothetical protein [Candidatus Nitrosocaldus sp.]
MLLMLVFIVYGVVIGLVSIRVRPWDPMYVINTVPLLIGDVIYSYSTRHIGDPSSPDAHHTVPWICRVPQIYLFTSTGFWGMVGMVLEYLY